MPAEQDRYTFSLAAPSLLYFDSLTNNANLRWSLTGPGGTPVSNRAFTGSDASGISGNPVLSLPAGAYTLTVSGVGGDHRRLLLPAARPRPRRRP